MVPIRNYKSFVMTRVSIILLIILVVCTLAVCCQTEKAATQTSQSMAQSTCELVVLADAKDPFYSLAKEIAAAENSPLGHNLSDALACHPIYLLWVVSPGFLSDEVIIEFGMTMKEQSSAVSIGIITGSTIELARELWQRRTQVNSQTFFAINAPNPSAHLKGQMLEFKQGQIINHPLDKDGFVGALKSADYLTFTGHGANSFLRLFDEEKITTRDIPTLGPIVIATGSCQTLRVWNDDSIARRIVDQGAAAYSGFVFSPNEGYLIGEFNQLPFRYTWQDFPIGHIIQAQNRGTLQGFARFPYQFLLGDPRIAFQSKPPYRLIDDRIEGKNRILKYKDVPAGLIPIRVADGAAYNFIEAPGTTSASQGDFIYNSRMQMINIGSDKFILLIHNGGDLTLRMMPNPPGYWMPFDILLDAIDYTYIFLQQSGGDYLNLGFAVIPLLWLVWQIRKKRIHWQNFRTALWIGFTLAVIQGITMLMRLPHVKVTSKAVVFSTLSLAGAFLLGSLGSMIYLQAHTWLGKLIGVIVITFPSWSTALFSTAVIYAFNTLAFQPRYGTWLYNQSLGLLSAVSFIISFIFFSVLLRFIKIGAKNGQFDSAKIQ